MGQILLPVSQKNGNQPKHFNLLLLHMRQKSSLSYRPPWSLCISSVTQVYAYLSTLQRQSELDSSRETLNNPQFLKDFVTLKQYIEMQPIPLVPSFIIPHHLTLYNTTLELLNPPYVSLSQNKMTCYDYYVPYG